ncbi:mRNA interferase MazF [Aurantimicrobium minutum]|uniref:type II toxin-antitoxin system PemK/MazF family toxin n=1 Tax=Aurantimicrobium minutum TaxID=708131 RepID=UPI002475CF63|nr:type II toxin-antitoxin system PemK/MazF family toxin [Aurantimicrobium minutum]MDH6532601.1 mRNA interferase MazF [Aurantimicrobium minutum]
MRRGEIWTVAGGTYSSKPRPGIIIQDDSAQEASSVTIIPLTSMPSELRRIRVAIRLETPDGESIESFAQVDKITTVKTSHVSKRIGALSLPEMRAIERSLLTHLGIGTAR